MKLGPVMFDQKFETWNMSTQSEWGGGDIDIFISPIFDSRKEVMVNNQLMCWYGVVK